MPLQRQGALTNGRACGGAAWHRAISSEAQINLPESATLADADNVARATLVDEPVREWTLVDDLGGGPPASRNRRQRIVREMGQPFVAQNPTTKRTRFSSVGITDCVQSLRTRSVPSPRHRRRLLGRVPTAQPFIGAAGEIPVHAEGVIGPPAAL